MQQYPLSEPLPCPQCDRNGFFRYSDSAFQCVYCNHTKHLGDDRRFDGSFLSLMILGFGFFVGLTFLSSS
jgi:hypothetical protein